VTNEPEDWKRPWRIRTGKPPVYQLERHSEEGMGPSTRLVGEGSMVRTEEGPIDNCKIDPWSEFEVE